MHKINIDISAGTGQGDTRLAAFDAALWKAGIANYNLIKLSSIIPPGSTIELKQVGDNGKNGFGNKLYTVLSERRESEKGKEAWAGIGWVQAEDGRGLFVEHEGAQEKEVIRQINETLHNMMRYRKEDYGSISYKVVGIECGDEPVCAVVAAIYKIEGWN